jgi:hypothetical protein
MHFYNADRQYTTISRMRGILARAEYSWKYGTVVPFLSIYHGAPFLALHFASTALNFGNFLIIPNVKANVCYYAVPDAWPTSKVCCQLAIFTLRCASQRLRLTSCSCLVCDNCQPSVKSNAGSVIPPREVNYYVLVPTLSTLTKFKRRTQS